MTNDSGLERQRLDRIARNKAERDANQAAAQREAEQRNAGTYPDGD